MKQRLSKEDFLSGIVKGDRTVISKAITLYESLLPEDESLSEELSQALKYQVCNSMRIGISGIPGAGKSTFIEGIGKVITGTGKKVAVLTIDPSSTITKGSIMGDKTRMDYLSSHPLAFIRSSPSKNFLGGTTPYTGKLIQLFEAAQYQVIIIETVGTGQSEVDVQSMTDYFIVLLVSGTGDELQIMKKGILEHADFILINKADGDNLQKAENLKLQIETTFKIIRPVENEPVILTFSSVESTGFVSFWNLLFSKFQVDTAADNFTEKRKAQLVAAMHATIKNKLISHFYRHPLIQQEVKLKEGLLIENKISQEKAVDDLINIFKKTL